MDSPEPMTILGLSPVDIATMLAALVSFNLYWTDPFRSAVETREDDTAPVLPC